MMKRVFLLFMVVLIVACHKDDPLSPAKAVLTFPLQNALCTSGAVISNSQSNIIFTWNPSAHADSYELNIKNLLTGTITTQVTATNQATVTLLRNTPFSWFVISKLMGLSITAQSDTWKFYNSGLSVVSYAPFPATITSPTFAQNVTSVSGAITLTWIGADVDNDIVLYDVYFGNIATPPLLQSSITNMFLNGVTVTSGVIYYWKVITKDSQGNTSDSGTFQFKVN